MGATRNLGGCRELSHIQQVKKRLSAYEIVRMIEILKLELANRKIKAIIVDHGDPNE